MRLSRQSLGNALSPDSYSPNGKLSPTGQVFLNCNRFPTSRARATSRLPHSSCRTCQFLRAVTTSLPASVSAAPNCQASSAAFAVPAAQWGLAANAASPMIQTRPNAMLGIAPSNIACINGSALSTSSVNAGGRKSFALIRSFSRCFSCRALYAVRCHEAPLRGPLADRRVPDLSIRSDTITN